jgi:hypothetical protein
MSVFPACLQSRNKVFRRHFSSLQEQPPLFDICAISNQNQKGRADTAVLEWTALGATNLVQLQGRRPNIATAKFMPLTARGQARIQCQECTHAGSSRLDTLESAAPYPGGLV